MSYKDIILNLSIGNKGTLRMGDVVMEDRFESVGKDFGYNFIAKVIEVNWVKLVDIFRIFNFANENQVSFMKIGVEKLA